MHENPSEKACFGHLCAQACVGTQRPKSSRTVWLKCQSALHRNARVLCGSSAEGNVVFDTSAESHILYGGLALSRSASLSLSRISVSHRLDPENGSSEIAKRGAGSSEAVKRQRVPSRTALPPLTQEPSPCAFGWKLARPSCSKPLHMCAARARNQLIA